MFRLSLHAYHFSFDSGIHSAIHSKIRPGNVRRFRTSDECHHRGDLVNLAITPESCARLFPHPPIGPAGSAIPAQPARTRPAPRTSPPPPTLPPDSPPPP